MKQTRSTELRRLIAPLGLMLGLVIFPGNDASAETPKRPRTKRPALPEVRISPEEDLEDYGILQKEKKSTLSGPQPQNYFLNLQFSPLGMANSRYNFSMSVRVADQLALGVKGTTIRTSKSVLNSIEPDRGWEAGAFLHYSFNDHPKGSWFLRPGLFQSDWERKSSENPPLFFDRPPANTPFRWVRDGFRGELLFGYRGYFEWGLNIEAGAGLDAFQVKRLLTLGPGEPLQEYASPSFRTSFVGEIGLGFAF